VNALRDHWGEFAALAVVGLAVLYLIFKFCFRKNKKAGSCCGTGCDNIPKK
jgi:hypothetical protein